MWKLARLYCDWVLIDWIGDSDVETHPYLLQPHVSQPDSPVSLDMQVDPTSLEALVGPVDGGALVGSTSLNTLVGPIDGGALVGSMGFDIAVGPADSNMLIGPINGSHLWAP